MHYSIYDVFYSQCSHQHVSAGIPSNFRVNILLQEYKRTNVLNCVTTSPQQLTFNHIYTFYTLVIMSP